MMRLTFVRLVTLVAAIVALPAIGQAQESTLGGIVTDSSGGVLPGVTVKAVHQATGNSFEAVTDEGGRYRLPVRAGVYQVTATLQGFATATRSGLELLVGQQAQMNLQMAPASVQESVTVTGEAPLIDVTQSSLGSNVDPRQLSELPVNGRNWVDLTMLAPGSRTNAVTETPLARDTGAYQLNVDGQQVTNNVGPSTFGQPRFSRDAIAEFQFVANRFDATQGRSSGVQVNAITKSGTNTPAGTFSGYFRNDRFNAADFIQKRVVPYSDQQLSGTFGGPIRKDRVHFFGNYEYEREPQTFTYTTPYPSFNVDQVGTRREHKAGIRVDSQFTSHTRLTVRANRWTNHLPYDRAGGATFHPASAITIDRHSDESLATLTEVVSNRAVNEIKAGRATFGWDQSSLVSWPNHPQAAANGITHGAPNIKLRSFTVGQTHTQTPQTFGQTHYSARDDFTYSFTAGGRHDTRLGAEYVHSYYHSFSCRNCMGVLDAQGGPVPANIEALFPVWNNVATWNLAPLTPITRKYTLGVGDFNADGVRHVMATWLQDDWAVSTRLTLNLGIRYDYAIGMWANSIAVAPFIDGNRRDDANNFGPRLGFVFKLDDHTVLRGGFGKYYADVSNQITSQAIAAAKQVNPEVLPDGRADFAANPFNGANPTFEQALRNSCSFAQTPTCLRRDIPSSLPDPNVHVPYSYQSSLGVQRQLGDVMSVEADWAYIGNRDDLNTTNINLSYNPATGVNYLFTDIARRPYPDWGTVPVQFSELRANYHALQTAFTKRFSRNWQASGNYLLSVFKDQDPLPHSGFARVAFPVPVDLGGEYGLASTDQRHRVVANGIWQLPHNFQLSGLYFFGSGQRLATVYGGDLRGTGGSNGRLRPDGTIVSRNAFVGQPIHRVDFRIQQRLKLGARTSIDGILEVFNVFNHANYGSYTTAENSGQFGQPSFNNNVAYSPRILQLGFRLAF